MVARLTHLRTLLLAILLAGATEGCRSPAPEAPPGPSIAPSEQPTSASAVVIGTNIERLEMPRAEAVDALCRLYDERDLDCDERITQQDEIQRCGHAECPSQPAALVAGRRMPLQALHHVSQLATELADALLTERPPAEGTSDESRVSVNIERAMNNPADYLVTRIQHRYWDALTRTIHPQSDDLWRALHDEKRGQAAAAGPNFCAQRLTRCAKRQTRKTTEAAEAGQDEPPPHLYVPAADANALKLYSAVDATQATVGRVPRSVDAAWVADVTRRNAHGLLTLAYDEHLEPLPFVVPGGRFNEMYGWDSFFITWGLIERSEAWAPRTPIERAHETRRLALATAMVEHQQYQITHYGKVLNANRTYYLTRSQPPFVAPLVRMVAQARKQHQAGDAASHDPWLEKVLPAAVAEYERVWSAPPRRTPLCDGKVCLARYFGQGTGQPPEVEPGHFAAMYQKHAVAHGHCPADDGSADSRIALVRCASNLERAYTSGELPDRELDEYFVHDRCMRESGHDTTFRWYREGREGCADHASIDLNALLFRYEVDLAQTYNELGDAAQAMQWCERAKARKRLIQRYLWDDERGLFVDYDLARGERSAYVSATTLYPLWASPTNTCDVRLVEEEQASRLVQSAISRLEAPGGLMATDPQSLTQVNVPTRLEVRGDEVVATAVARQWEAPNGWAPHQMLAWVGLQQHGFEVTAQRLAYRWLHMIVSNSARYHGTVPEKFDVQARSHEVFAEYGNVNADFSYIAREGFGWVNASVLVGLDLLTPEQRDHLRRLEPPESVFPSVN